MRTKIPAFLAGIVCSLAASGATKPAGPSAPIDPALLWTARENSEWKPVDMSRMVVEPGSILDVSRFIEIPAGKHGRIIIGADGHFAYENAPGVRIRFHGATLHPARELKRWYTDKAAIARLAEQLRRQGYNFVRLMSLDVWLMDESETALVFNPARVDAFHTLLRALKENGIYVLLDAMTTPTGYTRGGRTPREELGKYYDFKLGVYYSAESREHWKQGLKQILQQKNPYTGLALNDDPVLMGLVFFNEQNLNLGRYFKLKSPEYANLAPLWHEWLKSRYRTFSALRQAWTMAEGNILPAAATGFGDIPMCTYEWSLQKTAWGRDAGYFLQAMYQDLFAWFDGAAREVGFKGVVTHYDWIKQLDIVTVRNRLPVVSIHSYHAHPSNNYAPGSRVSQTSVIADEGTFFNAMVATRYGGRPFLITEYGQVFWNKFRYESGLLVGAYAALQGADGLNEHTGPVCEQVQGPVTPFLISHDPVARANHQLMAFMIHRQDVRASPNFIEVPLTNQFVFEDVNYQQSLSNNQAKFALICQLGVSYPDDPAPAVAGKVKPALRMPPFGISGVETHEMYDVTLNNTEPSERAQQVLSRMKEKGLLPSTNRTDFQAGIFESDTGELRLSRDERLLQVDTARLQGACLDPAVAKLPVDLSALRIVSLEAAGSLAFVSADDQPLIESGRILLVYATDALNQGMTFRDASREELVAIGQATTLLRVGKIHVQLKTNRAAQFKLWALGLDGKRDEELPVKAVAGGLEIQIDTGKLKKGPTPYFELAAP